MFDFLDFEHAGECLMYDCLSKIDRTSGGSYEFWDIGFLRVWNRKASNFGDGYIDKLFSDLPENTSIGNRTPNFFTMDKLLPLSFMLRPIKFSK